MSEASSSPNDLPIVPGQDRPLSDLARTTSTDQHDKTFIGAEPGAEGGGIQVSVGQKIGKYEIRKRLGEGGMGAVYLGFDPMIEREVALKVLTPEVANSPTALQRFLGEARAIGRLNHPHVVSIYEIDQWHGQYYLVMELLSGGSVAQLSEEQGALSWQEACRITAEAARGMEAAHAVGMIHRDIKPENLMLTKDGVVKVVDFGLSKLLDAANDPQKAVTKAGQILGTPQYMSPEQFEGQDLDMRTDIYSLGATFFRLLTSRYPYHDCRTIVQVMTAHLTKPPPNAAEHIAAIPPGCDRIITRAMAKVPADRYSSVAEMASELEALLGQYHSSRTVPPQPAFATKDHPLASALIVEPSKLQAAVLKDALSRSGVGQVQLSTTAAEALQAMTQHSPDLLVTAMQLSDGQGLDLIQTLNQRGLTQSMTMVVNSSDSAIEDLMLADTAATLVLAPKKVKADEILRVAHATGPGTLRAGPLALPVDPVTARLRLVLDSNRLPDPLAKLIREAELLDIEIVSKGTAGESAPVTATVLLHSARTMPNDGAIYAHLAADYAGMSGFVAVVQMWDDELWLRSVGRCGIVAVLQRRFDGQRLTCLLQAGRMS